MHIEGHTKILIAFSKHRPSGPMLSINRNVCPCVRVFVRLFTFEVPLKRLFAPTWLSKNFREIRNPFGKVTERSGLRFENFY
jgi:hypothetical protein